MSDFNVLDDLATQPGQSRDGRLFGALADHFVDIDERSPADLYRLMQQLSTKIRFFDPTSTASDGSGNDGKAPPNWANFFRLGWSELTAKANVGLVPPHLAVVKAFLEMYEEQRRLLNGLTAAHMDYQYRRVLGLTTRPPLPGRAHLLVRLKKNAGPVLIGESARFQVKAPDVPQLLYAPVRPAVISQCEVKSLCAIHTEPGARGGVRSAPMANSADGMGQPLGPDRPWWPAFGSRGCETLRWPRARVGFALASPILRLQGGARTVTVKLRIDRDSLRGMEDRRLEKLFEVSLTGQGAWVDLPAVSAELAGDILSFSVSIPATERPIVDYQEKVHGGRHGVKMPVMQLLLGARYNGSEPNRQEDLGYSDLAGWKVRSAQIHVLVSDLRDPRALQSENDAGPIDPSSAFPPFGPLPTRGARWSLGCEEAMSKHLTRFDVTVQWKGAPADLAAHYQDYGVSIPGNQYFTASYELNGALVRTEAPKSIALFDADDARRPFCLELGDGLEPVAVPFSDRERYRALVGIGTTWGAKLAADLAARRPTVIAPAEVGAGGPAARVIFTLENEDGFLHATYRRRQIELVMKHARAAGTGNEPRLLNEPYTPIVGGISIDYSAETRETRFDDTDSLDNYLAAEIRFLHVGCFGQVREHALQRKLLDLQASIDRATSGSGRTEIPPGVSLLPVHWGAEFFVGVSGLAPDQELNLLFQVAEGTAGPIESGRPPAWFVLCDNYWRPVPEESVLVDTTRGLRQSGLMRFQIPSQATLTNSLMAPGFIWLRGQTHGESGGIAQLVAVAANAIEVRLIEAGPASDSNSPAASVGQVSAVIPGCTPVACLHGPPGIQVVEQPFPSFGERAVETEETFRTRSSERLRHKGRCVTAWDYERLVLDAFPEIYLARCVPHSEADRWLTPGHVVLVVVPDPRRVPYSDLLHPVAGGDLLRRIREFVGARAGAHVRIEVRNPRRRTVDLEFQARFVAGPGFPDGTAAYRRRLREELGSLFAPWARASAISPEWDLSRATKVHRSTLLEFVHGRPYVAEVRNLRMFTALDGPRAEASEANTEAPDVILATGRYVIESVPERFTS